MTERQALHTAYRWTHFAVIDIDFEPPEYVALGYLTIQDHQRRRPWAIGRGYHKVASIGDLIQNNLRLNCRVVFDRQKWRCKQCGKYRALQGHHIKERGRAAVNRDDRIENISGLCVICHQDHHTGTLSATPTRGPVNEAKAAIWGKDYHQGSPDAQGDTGVPATGGTVVPAGRSRPSPHWRKVPAIARQDSSDDQGVPVR